MGIFKRLGDVARSNIEDLKDRIRREDKDGDDEAPRKPLRDMTDAELDAELERRRRARAPGAASSSEHETLPGKPAKRPPEPARAMPPRTAQEKSLARAYANLELAEGASLEQVKAAYRHLMERYHPDQHIGDPEAHAAALKLAQSLTKAYADLLAHLDPQRKG